MQNHSKAISLMLAWLLLAATTHTVDAQEGIPSIPPVARGPVPPGLVCTAEALNQNGIVTADGSVLVFNVPSGQGDVRLRLTCEDGAGTTLPGSSDLATPVSGGVTSVDGIDFENVVPPASTLTVSPSSFRLVGLIASQQLTVGATFADGSSGDVTPSTTGTAYTSSNAAVAEVDADGRVTARGTGTALITILNEGALGMATVSVLASSLVALETTPSFLELVINPLFGVPLAQLQVVGQLSDGTRVDLTSGASGTSYVSSDPIVVQVLGDGTAVGISAGSALLSVTNGSRVAEIEAVVSSFVPYPALHIDTPGFAHNVALDGSVAYVADGPGGLQVFDVKGSTPLAALAFDDAAAQAFDVRVQGELAAVALGSAGVALVDISNPDALSELVRIPGDAIDVALSGNRLYVAGSEGLKVYDLTDVQTPELVGVQGFAAAVRAVAADSARGVVVVLTQQPALEVLRLDGLSPWASAAVSLPGTADDVVLFGNTAYASMGRSGIQAVDLTDPTDPRLRGGSAVTINALGVAVRQTQKGTIVAAADKIYVNSALLFNGELRHVWSVNFPGDANGTGIALGATFGVVTAGSFGIQTFHFDQLIDNAGIPPVVTLIRPVDGTEIPAGFATFFRAFAIDDVAVAFVEFLVDGVQIRIDPTSPYTAIFPVGEHGTTYDVQVRATDLAGNSSSSQVVHVTAGESQGCDLDPAGDADQDGVTNGVECEIGSDPFDTDTDDDGWPDGVELMEGIDSDPLDASSLPQSFVFAGEAPELVRLGRASGAMAGPVTELTRLGRASGASATPVVDVVRLDAGMTAGVLATPGVELVRLDAGTAAGVLATPVVDVVRLDAGSGVTASPEVELILEGNE
jgi:hypothetical protein